VSPVHCCTAVSRNYLAHARVLAESFLKHHRDGRFSLLLVDRDGYDPALADELASFGSFELLSLEQVGIDQCELDRRATMYATQGMVASFKPDLLRALLAREQAPVVLLDADGCIYADLAPVAELAERHDVVLSPHSVDPYPLHGVDAAAARWRRDSPDQIVFRAGVMNGGLVAVGRGGEPFLRWWSQRTRLRCVFDEQYGLLLCQPWLTLAIATFDCAVLRDRGCNVAGWNLQARDVCWDGERPTIDGGPLRHFHFAGSFDPEHPQTLTPVATLADWWTPLAERPGTARLVREYAQRLLDRGHREVRATAGPNASMPDGSPIQPWMRELYRRELMAAEGERRPEPPNPFADGPRRFTEWAQAQAADSVERAGQAGGGHEPGLDLAQSQLHATLLEGGRLLERVGELEAARDDAVQWAQRVSGELRETELALVKARAEAEQSEGELRQLRTTMEGVWASFSWRATAPLRALKGRLADRR